MASKYIEAIIRGFAELISEVTALVGYLCFALVAGAIGFGYGFFHGLDSGSEPEIGYEIEESEHNPCDSGWSFDGSLEGVDRFVACLQDEYDDAEEGRLLSFPECWLEEEGREAMPHHKHCDSSIEPARTASLAPLKSQSATLASGMSSTFLPLRS